MGAEKLSLGPLTGPDRNAAKKQRAGLVEARIKDSAPHCKTPTWGGGGDMCAIAAKAAIREPKEGTAIETWNVRSLHACRKVQELTHELKRFMMQSVVKMKM